MMKSVKPETHTDIKRLVWIERTLPEQFRPYAYLMRVDRPIGVWLLLLPSLWGIMLGAGGLYGFNLATLKAVILFGIGAFVMRGAGCVVNDLWDRDLDKMVERTKNRPLASGAISPKKALAFLATLLLIGLIILLQFNMLTIILGCLSIPLVVSYPLMKRITWWPQLFLGLTFNFGVLMGWSAVTGELSVAPFLLYFGAMCWTIGYDTIYAHQDKEDDALIGVKSTALFFGEHSQKWVSGFYAISILLTLFACIAARGFGLNLLILALPALHFAWQIKNWEPDDPSSSLNIFKANKVSGLLMLLCLCIL